MTLHLTLRLHGEVGLTCSPQQVSRSVRGVKVRS